MTPEEFDMTPSFPLENDTKSIDHGDYLHDVDIRIDALSMYGYAIINRFDDKEVYAHVRGRVDDDSLYYTGGNVIYRTPSSFARDYILPDVIYKQSYENLGEPNIKADSSIRKSTDSIPARKSSGASPNVPNPPGGGYGEGGAT